MRRGPGPPGPRRPLARPHLILRRLHGRPVLREHHGQGEEEHEQPVAHVAEHDGEEEGEGDDGVGSCGQRGPAVSQGPQGNVGLCALAAAEAPTPGSGTRGNVEGLLAGRGRPTVCLHSRARRFLAV